MMSCRSDLLSCIIFLFGFGCFLFRDEKQRQHKLQVKFPSNYPDSPLQWCRATMPQPFEMTFPDNTTSSTTNTSINATTNNNNSSGSGASRAEHSDLIHYAFRTFCATLKSYADLWDQLDEFDARAWVLEPEKPTAADCFRRIALGTF